VYALTVLLAAGCASSGSGGPPFLRFTLDGTEYAYGDPMGRVDGSNVIVQYDDWRSLGRLTLRFPLPGTGHAGSSPLTDAAYLPSTGGEYTTALGGHGSVRIAKAPSCESEDVPPGEFLGAPVGGRDFVCTIEGSFAFVAYREAGDSVTVTDGEFRVRY
jgi:hypothetical protein